jgi:hypothetical protein
MSMADLDDDGDLDIVVNNLNSPAQLFENRLCNGDGLLVELRWTGVGEAPGPLLLTVRWPDGLVSHISPVAPNTRLTVMRAQALMADGGNEAP